MGKVQSDLTGHKQNTSPQMAETHSFAVTGPNCASVRRTAHQREPVASCKILKSWSCWKGLVSIGVVRSPLGNFAVL
jgi:hypothetical protein